MNYLTLHRPAPEVIALIAEVVALEPAASTGSPSSTTIDQDAPSPSNSQTTPETQSPVISNDVKEENHDLDVTHMNNDPLFGILIPENDSSSLDVIPTIVHTAAPNPKHVTKWTKDHPLDNIIAMQEELNEFERLEVWELVPRPDKVMFITLRWIYKAKLDELGGIMKNKARLVARDYVTTLEKEVVELKKDDPLNTQVKALVYEHLDSRLGATRDEFMRYLLASITARITEQVKIQLPHILLKEVSNFAPLVIKIMVTESLEHAVLAMEECYDGLIKYYDLNKSLFSTYDKVYSLKRSRKDKDKDEDPSTGSD
ncbi:retrovirus-related pol polyprotein from transposon TNT 1-94 [Tanacetum coccineum]|uniref:Retrovirus-related pol polyprotein from transposon TNT 1-94 n=1 Tax=Tanacetum coccineum TaxID=301880 RepID=A0ABQ5HTE4_9ASTR